MSRLEVVLYKPSIEEQTCEMFQVEECLQVQKLAAYLNFWGMEVYPEVAWE